MTTKTEENTGMEQHTMAIDKETTEPASDRRRWLALYVLCVGMLMIVLDVTVVNVALPSIKQDLGFSQSSLAWVVNAYLIAFAGCSSWPDASATSSGGRTSSWPGSHCSRWPPSRAGRRRRRRCSSSRASS